MRRANLVVVTVVLVFAFTTKLLAESELYQHVVEKIADGVYVAYRPEPLRPFVEGNVTIIINDDDVVVVDAGGSDASARDIISHIRKLTTKPVRTLINTHDHVDHTLGNTEFARQFPGLEIISTEETRKHLIEDGVPYVSGIAKDISQQLKRGEEIRNRLVTENKPGVDKVLAFSDRYYKQDIYTRQAEYQKATITPATSTYETKLTLYRGGRTIEVLFLGWGDTPGDTVVYLSKEKIACTGDMLTEPVPYGFTVKPSEWITTLKKLRAMDVSIFIPGHGAIQRDRKYLDQVVALIENVQEQVRASVAAGNDLEATRKKVDLNDARQAFAKGDPVTANRFDAWFADPAIEVAFERVKEK